MALPRVEVGDRLSGRSLARRWSGIVFFATILASLLLWVGVSPTASAAYPGTSNGAIAYTAVIADIGGTDILRLNSTGHVKRLTYNGSSGQPAWSPSGGRIAYIQAGDVRVMQASGSGKIRLTNLGGASSPTWSGDGKRVAFLRNGDIFTVASDGAGSVVRVTFRGASCSRDTLQWSASIPLLVFNESCAGIDRVVGVNPSTRSRTIITQSDGQFFRRLLEMAPDGQTLALDSVCHTCSGEDEGDRHFLLMNLDGVVTQTLAAACIDCQGAPTIANLTLAPDGGFFYTVWHTSNFHELQISTSAAPWGGAQQLANIVNLNTHSFDWQARSG